MKILGKRVGDYDDHTFGKPRILNYGVVYDRHPFKKMNDYLYLVAAEPARLTLYSICDEKEIYSFKIPEKLQNIQKGIILPAYSDFKLSYTDILVCTLHNP